MLISAKEWLLLGLFALCGVAVNQVLFVEGLARTTAAHSALIMTMIPLLTIVFAVALGKERFSMQRAVGLAVALGGVWVLLRADRFRVEGDLLTGDALMSYWMKERDVHEMMLKEMGAIK